MKAGILFYVLVYLFVLGREHTLEQNLQRHLIVADSSGLSNRRQGVPLEEFGE